MPASTTLFIAGLLSWR